MILPFWSNFLIRVYAWMIILGPNAALARAINALLAVFGAGPVSLLFSSFAVLVCLVYVHLPFMVLPLYANLEKHDQALLDRPGNVEIQLDLFYDYRTNVALYPRFQAFFREHQPPTLIVWGANDTIFPAAGARAFLRDLPNAELHLLDSGHFALEDKGDEIVPLMRDFLGRHLPAR